MADMFRLLTQNDFDNDKEDHFNAEAPPEIKILLIREQPQGTGLHKTLTLNPAVTTLTLKTDLANVTNVPAEFITLIHRNSIMEDDTTLRNQRVEPNDVIVLRDNRLVYNFP